MDAARLTTAALLLAGLLAGCGATEESRDADELTVYVSLPLAGDRPAASRAVAAGAKAALAERDGRAGEIRIEAVYLDNTGGGPGPDPVAVARNARRATEDSTTIAYIGDLGRPGTSTSLPITNQAGILQVDPGLGPSPLSRRLPGLPDPERFRPSGEESFVPLRPANLDTETCPGPADFGHEAMSLVLDAVEAEGASRDDVIEWVLSTPDRSSRIGTYTLNEDGEVLAEPAPGCEP